MIVENYLRRIGYTGSTDPTLANLQDIQRAHATAIPYETLDIFLSVPMAIDLPTAYDKIVNRQRGGWCYEHNGLLGWALGELGFHVRRMTAAVDRPATHLALRIEIPEIGTYICDPGFSDGPLAPFPLANGPFEQHGFEYHIDIKSPTTFHFTNHALGLAKGFTAGPVDELAMINASEWLQTAQDSRLTSIPIACLREGDGAIVCLSGTNLLRIFPCHIDRRRIESSAEYTSTLADIFRLTIPNSEELWVRLLRINDEYNRRKAEAAVAKIYT